MSGDIFPLSVPIYIVDAFTDRPFSGNPAAICLVSPGQVLTNEQMQRVGTEMNLPETAFISLDKGDFVTENVFGLRFFTPTVEIDLCGHATLASAAILFKELGNSSNEITFTSRSGPLTVKRFDKTKISLNLPENAPSPVNLADYKDLLKVTVTDECLVQDIQLSKTGLLIVRLKDDVTRETFEELNPQIDRMVEADVTKSLKGLGITLKGLRENGCVDSKGNVYDFVSRYFVPWIGVPEDPVTGSWHTVASPYWAKELNKVNLYAHQCSKRGGDLWLTVERERVILTGDSVINLRGMFSL
uniref:Phenazine biosynthesis-like domain-containing protein n=1 Tax=Arion vulgaris TaxID=1028688 RepID=A0A0B7AB47_9EUPU